MEEGEILLLLQTDWETGCAAVVEQYQHLLWGICAKRLENPEDIRECVFAAISDFCLQWKRFQPEVSSLKTYLGAIADRRALDCYRQNSRWQKALTALSLQTPSHSEGEGDRAREMLDQLSPLDAQILKLRYLEGLRYREIARLLHMNDEAVKKRGQRAVKKLQKQLRSADEAMPASAQNRPPLGEGPSGAVGAMEEKQYVKF